MSRPPRAGVAVNHRERLKQDFSRAAPLRNLYPRLAELRIEFEFRDGSPRAPSPQSFSYFPPAQGFFRYACPCHSCTGEFDLSEYVAELTQKPGNAPRSRRVEIVCPGQRSEVSNLRGPCPINAQVRLTATLHKPE